MKSLRLALVTRRFWPLVGGAEMVMANLATEFLRLGHHPVILTARWESHWPKELVHREVPVVRLPNPARRFWGTIRYMSALGRWLRRHQGELDAVYASMLKHDAYVAVTALQGSRVPVVLRAEGAGASGDCAWHATARFGGRIKRRCLQADALVAPSRPIVEEMRLADFPADKVKFIPNGVRVPPMRRRDAAIRSSIREALAEVNHDLVTASAAPVVIYTGRLDRAKGLRELVTAWPQVSVRHPDARLWIVGEGPFREDLYELILDLQLRGRVLLPGAFDDVEDLLLAADVFVLPSYEEGMSLSLLEAMASGLPVVATDIPANRKLVAHQEHGLLVPPRDVAALAAAINRQLEQRMLAESYAVTARSRVEQHYSLTASAEGHLRLVEELIARKADAPQ